MKVWERFNEIRGENKTLDEIYEMVLSGWYFTRGYCPPVMLGNLIFDMRMEFIIDTIAEKLHNDKFCDNENDCEECIKAFLEMDCD